MLSVIRTIIRKEFIQLFRDKRMILPLFVAPVLQLILFGFAVTVDIKNITLAVVDNDRTQDSRAYVAAFARSGYFEIKAEPESSAEVDALLDAGTVQAAIVIPPGIRGADRGARRGRRPGPARRNGFQHGHDRPELRGHRLGPILGIADRPAAGQAARGLPHRSSRGSGTTPSSRPRSGWSRASSA